MDALVEKMCLRYVMQSGASLQGEAKRAFGGGWKRHIHTSHVMQQHPDLSGTQSRAEDSSSESLVHGIHR